MNFLVSFALALLCLFAPASAGFCAALRDGSISIVPPELKAGSSFLLNGNWLYRPRYNVGREEKPETNASVKGYGPVRVPQFLNRIHWWLDDSADFQKFEDARLARLGFDTDRADDGWYRLNLDLPAIPSARRLFLEFEGVAMKCRVYCNGKLLGDHAGMFSRFDFDLTPALRPGANNLSVFVSMEKIPASEMPMGEAVTVNLTSSKVRSMSKGMFGPLGPGYPNRSYDLHGIWQPVRLVVRGTARLEDTWFIPSLNGAEVRIQTSSINPNERAKIKAVWSDAVSGKKFASLQSPLFNPALETNQLLSLSHVKPRLWTPANPNLYRLEVSLETEHGKLIDRWSHLVGFRTFTVSSNRFLLNGHPYWLRGANHLPYGKNPFDPALPRRLIRALHDANVRVTRTHATPWNETWLDAADEIGLGVSLEGIRPWAFAGKIGATPPDLFKHWLMENEDVVKRARNHPCVLIYTVGNEMMLRDPKNLEKWTQLSDVVKQTRRLDPGRPVIASSEYAREPEVFNDLLRPNHLDDGDADDLHRYHNWYRESSFVADFHFKSELTKNQKVRPLMGQEMSSGYPDLDNGLPVLRYTRDLVTPQAWVGQQSYPGSDPSIFLEHHRAVTKRWAEQLRFQREGNTAGFMLFAAECWFHHSYDPQTLAPYPVVSAIREAFSPIGLALESPRFRFASGEAISTAVYITNDDDEFRNYEDLELEVKIQSADQRDSVPSIQKLGRIPSIPYGETLKVPIHYRLPEKVFPARSQFTMVLRCLKKGTEISRTSTPIEICSKPPPPHPLDASVILLGLTPNLTQFAHDFFHRPHLELKSSEPANSLVLAGPAIAPQELAPGGSLRTWIENGGTAILFSPSAKIAKLFPEQILNVTTNLAEFADWVPVRDSVMSSGLKPMDLKWWSRPNDERLFIASQSHRLRSGADAREFLRYIPPHSYISADKVPEQYRTVLFQLTAGKGRIWICDLDLEQCLSREPLARQFTENLWRAAVDPDFEKGLHPIPSHEELLSRESSRP